MKAYACCLGAVPALLSHRNLPSQCILDEYTDNEKITLRVNLAISDPRA
jgi:hypothetical protein